jgi:hypothetical protein
MTPAKKYSEPSLASVVNKIFGYTTTITKPGETTNHGGRPVFVGDEINAPYWMQADPAMSISVRQIAAFHRQNNVDPITGEPLTAASTIGYYYKGKSSSITKIVTHNIDEGQALLQHISGSSSKPALANFRQKDTSTPFGFVVDKNHFTDDSLNALDFDPKDPNKTGIPGTGHSFRIFPLKDANGKVVKNTYIFAMDYTSNEFANWDYQDNIYIINNLKPAGVGTSALKLATTAAPKSASLFSTAGVDPGNQGIDILRDGSAIL